MTIATTPMPYAIHEIRWFIGAIGPLPAKFTR
jgi:hypothetical protein